jgi:hypothetical protein
MAADGEDGEDWKAQFDELEAEFNDFQETSREVERALEVDVERAQTAEKAAKEKLADRQRCVVLFPFCLPLAWLGPFLCAFHSPCLYLGRRPTPPKRPGRRSSACSRVRMSVCFAAVDRRWL